jgi:hypothetical protein
MATVRNVEVVSDKFYVDKIGTYVGPVSSSKNESNSVQFLYFTRASCK